MLLELKGRATRWLRDARLVADNAQVWAAGGSRRYLWTDADAAGAADYEREGQDRPKE